MTKIAIIGSAPSSVRFAPYSDLSWQIWACSPGAYPHVPSTRANAFFELHRWEPPEGYTGAKPWFTTDYIKYMASLKCPVYMIEPVPEIPTSVAYPKDKILEAFETPEFFTSSIAWMLALAIMSGATEIALYGIDMAAEEEWEAQKLGCLFFIRLARLKGIKVTIPPESDLLRSTPMYGFCEVDHMHIKLTARRRELEARIKDAEARYQAAWSEFHYFKGALHNLQYDMKTWIADPKTLPYIYGNSTAEAPQPKPLEVTMEPTITKANGAVPLQAPPPPEESPHPGS